MTLILLLSAAAASARISSNYIRLQRTACALELQTANVQLSLSSNGRPFELSLVSTVHLAEPPYYAALQREADSQDRVLFELLADESAVDTDDNGVRRLKAPLHPAPALASLAAQNRLTTQVSALDCCGESWVLADVSRRQLSVQEARLRGTRNDGGPLGESLLRLAGGRAGRAGPLRLLLCFLPAPELGLLLDDWLASRGATVAPGLRALLVALGRLDLGAASRLSFAQTLASGEATQAGSLAGSLVRWRNERAIAEVDRAIEAGCGRVALVYGALHMRDLRQRLQSRYELMAASEPQWQTAWSIPLSPESEEGPTELIPPAAALLLLLSIDASDWIEVIGGTLTALLGDQSSLDLATACLTPLLYLVRHAVLYLAIQRWAFEWDARWWAVESEDVDG
jgi:hypothetical protein